MARKIFKYLFPILCVLIVVVAFVLIFKIKNKVENSMYDTEKIEEVESESEITENTAVLNEESTEPVLNEIGNVVENTTNTVENDFVPEDVTIEEGSTTKKQEAINIVKKKWGANQNVTFKCEGTNSKGEYIVAVRNLAGKIEAYFNVNLETKEAMYTY